MSTAFPRGNIQSSATYKVKFNNVRADAVIDLNTNRVTEIARQALSDSSGFSIIRMGWLSGPGKRYGSMIVQFTQKADADKVLARGLLKVGGESACTTVWMEKSRAQRCFNCQQFGHMASHCPNMTVCGNCAATGHTHQECTNAFMKCANCQGQHRANYAKCPAYLNPRGAANHNAPKVVEALLSFSPLTSTDNTW